MQRALVFKREPGPRLQAVGQFLLWRRSWKDYKEKLVPHPSFRVWFLLYGLLNFSAMLDGKPWTTSTWVRLDISPKSGKHTIWLTLVSGLFAVSSTLVCARKTITFWYGRQCIKYKNLGYFALSTCDGVVVEFPRFDFWWSPTSVRKIYTSYFFLII